MIASQGLRWRRIRATAVLLTVLSLLVVALSAYLRLDAAGLGCADWPGCYARSLAGEPQALPLSVARLLHRATASLSLLLACALVWDCRRRPAVQSAARPATLLLLLMLVLSMLGIWSADPRRVLVGFLNIIGGLSVVALSWQVVLASRPRTLLDRVTAPTVLLHLGAAALLLTVVLGALIGAGHAALAGAWFPDYGGDWFPGWPPAAGWAGLRPFATLSGTPLADDPGGIALHALHRYAALATLLLLGSAGLQALTDETRRPAAITLLVLLASAIAVGSLTVTSGFSLWLAISHVVCAALLLAAVVTLLRR
ncbi:Cytochrome oxidase assembly [Candidatus Accumulibacter aalborgensis]|uniref:Cytochrome oxidase assembly n=1 Tax=Candidatus Accumulibacter aalborgensis TaxID=1860102 RepID=A0A1A8XM98_9PROT|nr:COX15/CtaA family protein [Candidatus Accumulibacter aalborgensis]SBT06294.1 Cytochrome oxidase assembly [Candidatus Accumulibacter aalborgensis]